MDLTPLHTTKSATNMVAHCHYLITATIALFLNGRNPQFLIRHFLNWRGWRGWRGYRQFPARDNRFWQGKSSLFAVGERTTRRIAFSVYTIPVFLRAVIFGAGDAITLVIAASGTEATVTV